MTAPGVSTRAPRYYPIFVDLEGRRCVVVGGGEVAERKVVALLEAGASITVIAPRVTAGLRDLIAAGALRHVARRYRAGDLAGAQLAFVATDDLDVNAAVAAESERRGVLVNAADDPRHCDFILPSVLRRGPLTVAVSTGGASPAVARAIREELEAYLTDGHGALAALAAEVRHEARRGAAPPDAEAWRRALGADLRLLVADVGRLVAEGKRDEAKRRLLDRLGEAPCR